MFQSRLNTVRNEESGFTLIEVLVALSILGIAIVALLAGMATAVQASDHHRKQANAETVLVRAVENLKSQDYQYCPTAPSASPYSFTTTFSADGIAAPTIDKVEVWDGANFHDWWAHSAYSPSGCGTTFDDGRLQRITLSVKSLDSRASESTTFVKRGVE
jgi:prepilin-type N-terminal cleavage/methylation domain-containing protein